MTASDPIGDTPNSGAPEFAGGPESDDRDQLLGRPEFTGRPKLAGEAADDATASEGPGRRRYGVWIFSLREAILLGLIALVLIASFLPIAVAPFTGYVSVWAPFPLLAVPGVLVLLAAALLIVLRRVAPSTSWRVGSLSVDQFASVAVVVTGTFYLFLWILVASVSLFGISVPGAGVIVGFIASLLALGVTVLGPFIPPFADDFTERSEIPAHRVAREALPVARRPRPEPRQRPEQASPAYGDAEAYAAGYAEQNGTAIYGGVPTSTATGLPDAALMGGPRYARSSRGFESPEIEDQTAVEPETAVHEDADLAEESAQGQEPAPRSAGSHVTARAVSADRIDAIDAIDAGESNNDTEVLNTSAELSAQPFWVYSPVPRTVVDEVSGAPLFEIGPDAWALAIADRGSDLVIRHDDGRVGVLRQLEGLMRG